MHNFDPQPAEYPRHICTTDLNNFLSDLPCYNSSKGQLSMWETVFHYMYSDFELEKDDIELYTSLVETLENNVHYAVKQQLNFVKCLELKNRGSE